MSIVPPVLPFCFSLLLLPLVSFAHDVSRDMPADKNDPELVFAYQGDAVLTQVGIDAAFSNIPERDRMPFIRDGARVDRMVRNIMRTEVIALDAIKNGFDEDPLVVERMIQAAHRELAKAWLDQIPKNAPAADYEAMAYEDYLVNPENYQTKEFLDVTHILIATENRTDEEALALAMDLRERAIADPASFTALVLEYSDDPAKEQNQGSYPRMTHGQMADQFEDAAFALENEGDISEPVRTDYGYHIIRLDKRYEPKQKSFEEVREEAVAEMKKQHQEKHLEIYVKGLLSEGIVLPEGSVEVMLKRHFGENLENAPRFDQN